MWTLLKAPEDWEEHKKVVARTMMVRDELVKYGAGPKTYPALVCSLIPPKTPDPSKHEVVINSAYVYEADAEILLKAAGRHLRDPDAPVPSSQREFNLWVAAQLMTITYYLVETGICAPGVARGEERKKANETAYEDKLSEMRELAEQYHGERKDELRKGLAGYAATVLDTLDPPR